MAEFGADRTRLHWKQQISAAEYLDADQTTIIFVSLFLFLVIGVSDLF
jgi:hypothetical protein